MFGLASERLVWRLIDRRDEDTRQLREAMWKLEERHNRLLKHLGLSEDRVPEHVRITSKGEPEQP